jgi:hypothetical protein
LNDKRKKTLLGIPLWLLALAGLIGILFGSLRQVEEAVGRRSTPQPTTVEEPVSPANDSTAVSGGEPVTADGSRSTPVEPGVQFRASEGLIFEPARINGKFIGFRVISNRDDIRVQVGDIVVSVNGMPVEDSAAGSELFIASLSNPDAVVQLHQLPGRDR